MVAPILSPCHPVTLSPCHVVTESALAQDRVHDPATADVLRLQTAVIQDVRVLAAGLFQSITQDGKVPFAALGVDDLGNPADTAPIPFQPAGIDGRRAERVAE